MSTGQRRARRIREESDSNNRTINPRNPSRLQSRSHSVSLGGGRKGKDEEERKNEAKKKKGRREKRRQREESHASGGDSLELAPKGTSPTMPAAVCVQVFLGSWSRLEMSHPSLNLITSP